MNHIDKFNTFKLNESKTEIEHEVVFWDRESVETILKTIEKKLKKWRYMTDACDGDDYIVVFTNEVITKKTAEKLSQPSEY
jgi:hypothetical protein